MLSDEEIQIINHYADWYTNTCSHQWKETYQWSWILGVECTICKLGVSIPRFKLETKSKSCNHNWKQYIGFTDTYKYCEACNEKQS